MTTLADLWDAATGPGRVLLVDDAVRTIAAVDCGEPLVEATGSIATRPDIGQLPALGPAGVLVRAGVLARLRQAAAALAERDGWTLALVEGHRTLERQRLEYRTECARQAAGHPDWTPEQVRRETSAFVAPPDPDAPHAGGGAVDVTILGPGGEPVDVGCPLNATSADVGPACFTGCPDLPAAARAVRGALVAAMTGAGFVNYPSEWWHWSYGDRFWAHATTAPHALYGGVPAPPPAPVPPTASTEGARHDPAHI